MRDRSTPSHTERRTIVTEIVSGALFEILLEERRNDLLSSESRALLATAGDALIPANKRSF